MSPPLTAYKETRKIKPRVKSSPLAQKPIGKTGWSNTSAVSLVVDAKTWRCEQHIASRMICTRDLVSFNAEPVGFDRKPKRRANHLTYNWQGKESLLATQGETCQFCSRQFWICGSKSQRVRPSTRQSISDIYVKESSWQWKKLVDHKQNHGKQRLGS
jgi:hypothetical protein